MKTDMDAECTNVRFRVLGPLYCWTKGQSAHEDAGPKALGESVLL